MVIKKGMMHITIASLYSQLNIIEPHYLRWWMLEYITYQVYRCQKNFLP